MVKSRQRERQGLKLGRKILRAARNGEEVRQAGAGVRAPRDGSGRRQCPLGDHLVPGARTCASTSMASPASRELLEPCSGRLESVMPPWVWLVCSRERRVASAAFVRLRAMCRCC